MLESWKVAPALAWGNTVVLKPAEDTPKSATMLARLAAEAGLPPGVLNVVHGFGPDSAGSALTQHRGVDRITFTGESGTGAGHRPAAAANLTPVSFELGGKGANLVFDDADLDNAVALVDQGDLHATPGRSAWPARGCSSQRGVYDEFMARFVAAAEALTIGDPKDPATELGPLASRGALRRRSAATSTTSPPARRQDPHRRARADGWFVRPTVVVDAPLDCPVVCEEIFGPVVTVHPFDTEEEAVGAGQRLPYGLNAMVFTENLSRAHRVSAARCGPARSGSTASSSATCARRSAGSATPASGREGGNFSREFFTEPKAVVMQI